MAEVDPVTGYPIGEIDNAEMTAKNLRLREQKARSDQLQASINSETGQAIINKIQEQLLARVNKLIDEDAECNALKKLIIGMGLEIHLGERAVQNLIRLVVRK